MAITVRIATPEDATLLKRLQYVAERAAYFNFMSGDRLVERPATDWEAWMACLPPFARRPSKRVALIAYIHGEPAGFAAVRHGSSEPDYEADLTGLYIDPAHTRQGIGSRLFAEVRAYLLEHHVHTLLVEAFADNPYRQFYDKLGGTLLPSADEDIVRYGFHFVAPR